MKIGFISTYSNATPPLAYGGETYYWGLADTLGKMGHEVHLFAGPASETPTGGHLYLYRGTKDGIIDMTHEVEMEKEYHDLLMSMDIVHDCSLSHIPAERLRNLYGKREIVNTINGVVAGCPRPPFNIVTGSKFWQNEATKEGVNSGMIYWGVDTDFYTPQGDREDYFLWLARFHPDKGIDLALDLAEFLGFPLVVAGSMQFLDHAYHGARYLERIKGMENVKFVQLPMDSTHHLAKRELYRKAKAFLFPVNYREGFGLVTMEAMACGCPVITSDKGAMPELVDHEKTGFICRTKQDYKQAIENTRFDQMRMDCRNHAGKFSWKVAAMEYNKLYEKVRDGYAW